MSALAATTVLAVAPPGATAETAPAAAANKAAAVGMLKRLDLDAGRPRRGAAKRPPRSARPTKPARARAAVFYTDECDIRQVIDYFSNSTVKPYTWTEFKYNGIWYGYETLSRWGWRYEWPSGYDRPYIRTCSDALGYQYEWFRWNGARWVWFTTVNCDVSNYCRNVR